MADSGDLSAKRKSPVHFSFNKPLAEVHSSENYAHRENKKNWNNAEDKTAASHFHCFSRVFLT